MYKIRRVTPVIRRFKMKKNLLGAFLTAVFLLGHNVASFAAKTQSPSPARPMIYRPVAFVNDVAVTPRDLQKRIALMRILNNVPANAPVTPQEKRNALETAINEVLQKEEITKFEIEPTKKETETYRARILRGNRLRNDAFVAALPTFGLTETDVDKILKTRLAWERLTGGRFARDVSVSSYEIQQLLEQINRLGNIEVKYREIVQNFEKASEAPTALKAMETALKQLQSGAAFEKLAARYPDKNGVKTANGVEWVSITAVEQAAQRFLALSEPGTVSPVMQTERGYVVVQLTDRRVNKTELEPQKRVLTAFIPGGDIAAGARFQSEYRNCEDFEDASDEEGVAYKDYGYVTANVLPAELQAGARAASANDILPPVVTADGVYIAAVCGVKKPDIYANANPALRERLRNQIYEQKMSLRARQYLRDLRDKATINMN